VPASTSSTDLLVCPKWRDDPVLFAAARALFTYGGGDDRATGQLYADGEQGWPASFVEAGPALLDALDGMFGVRFTVVAFQAYRDGAGCAWHADTPFDAQAVLSLGVSRTFGVRPTGGEPQWVKVEHGDLVYMPPGFQVLHEHCVPVEDVAGERISLVFRTVVRG
jgi:alkylated DNA repair dioxygenase AlkB